MGYAMQIFSEASQDFNIKSAAKIILSILVNIPEWEATPPMLFLFL